MNMQVRNLGALLATGLIMAAGLTGCTQQQQMSDDSYDNDPAPAATTEAPRPASTNRGVYSPDLGSGEGAVAMAFPTGELDTSAILLHQVMPREVRRGEDFEYSYHVTNLTSSELQNVVVGLESTNNLDVKSSAPAAARAGSGLAWTLGSLGANETKIIKLIGAAGEVGTASDCITVSYNNFLCATTNVVEPALALTKTAPATASKCDDICMRYVVTNTGSGAAADVVISDTLPVGLTLSDGSRNVRIPVGTLAAGESKAFEVCAEANRTGSFASPASANASGGLRASADETNTVVTAPELSITSECSDDQFLGRNFTHTYTVSNDGNGAANSTVASISLPSGSSVVRTSAGGSVQGGRVVFDLGSLAAGASESFSVTMSGSNAQAYATTATVNAECAASVSDNCSSSLKGIPAILLEVIDITDPVEVGQETVYVITVTNQGSAPDNNVRIVATLPVEQTYVSATGATSVNSSGRTLTMAPVGTLGVGQQVAWRVTVRANAEADSRFRIEMTSDNLTSPVIETEATNLYR